MLHHRKPHGRRRRRTGLRLLLAAVSAALSLSLLQIAPDHASAASAAGGPRASKAAAAPDDRPNIVLISTDDQTLSDLAQMRRTNRLIGAQGVTFKGISPHPLCCPARAEVLTGQFAQNNGVRSNTGAYGGYKRLDPSNTVATWLHDAGYHTMFMGKYLNGYRSADAAVASQGWDDWNPTVEGVYNYTDFTVSHNEQVETVHEYQTDYFTDLAVAKIEEASELHRPFVLWQSYVAPHVECPPVYETATCWRDPQPAPRHSDMFPTAMPPSMDSPAFNESEATFHDKPFPLNQTAEIGDAERDQIVQLHRSRLRALQAVDEGVERTVETLRSTGELANTLIIFVSDNGYLLGEHRYTGKVMPYEPALRVPFLMRGPGLPRGVERQRTGTLVDLAPTIAAAAHVVPGRAVDGRNLLPTARVGAPSWETLLIQAGPYRPRDEKWGWFYRGVRTARYTYTKYPFRPHATDYPFNNHEELYNRAKDPAELHNLVRDPRYAPVLAELRRRAALLSACTGALCRTDFGPVPAPLK